jgi:hypothetical protein
MIYSLYIFDRHCRCVYFQDWHRRLQSTASGAIATIPPTPGAPPSRSNTLSSLTSSTLFSPSGTNVDTSQTSNPGNGLPVEEEAKLVYGVVYSLRNIVTKLSKTGNGNFFAFRTNIYKLHHLSTLSCMRFVLLTDPDAGDCREILHNIYARCYVEYVVKNPLARPSAAELMIGRNDGAYGYKDVTVDDIKSDEYTVSNEYFRSVVNKYIRSLALYAS